MKVYSVHPGIIRSGLQRHTFFPQGSCVNNMLDHVFFDRDEAQGATTTIYAATSPDLEPHSGAHLFNCKASSPFPTPRPFPFPTPWTSPPVAPTPFPSSTRCTHEVRSGCRLLSVTSPEHEHRQASSSYHTRSHPPAACSTYRVWPLLTISGPQGPPPASTWTCPQSDARCKIDSKFLAVKTLSVHSHKCLHSRTLLCWHQFLGLPPPFRPSACVSVSGSPVRFPICASPSWSRVPGGPGCGAAMVGLFP